MFVREFKPEDSPELYRLLFLENIPQSNMEYENGETYVLENHNKVIGFYTIEYLDDNRLQLVHFCINKNNRNGLPALKILLSFEKKIKDKMFVVNVAKKNKALIAILGKAFNIIECYFVDDKKRHYLASYRRRK